MLNQASKLAVLCDFMFNPARDIEVFGMFGAGNLGDEAMLVAARQELGARRCVPWKYYRNRLLNGLVLSRRHGNLFVVGGTLIHGGKTDWLDYVEHRFDQKVPVSFFGTGMAFTEDQIAGQSDSYKRWARILRGSRHVHLRGPASAGLAQGMGARAGVFGDFAFLLHDPERPPARPQDRRNIIGLNFGQCLGDQEDFERRAAALVSELAGRHELIFHAVVEGDVPVTLRIASAAGLCLDEAGIEKHYRDPRAFMDSVRHYRAFLGLKMHAAGLAMIAGVPSLMIAYLPKARDFMAPLGRDDLLIDLPVDVEGTLEKLARLLDYPGSGILADRIGAVHAGQRRILRDVLAGL